MSRNGSKKPVGFSTHVIAGGFAGACEAVSGQPCLLKLSNPISPIAAGMSAPRYNKGSNATLEVRTNTGST